MPNITKKSVICKAQTLRRSPASVSGRLAQMWRLTLNPVNLTEEHTKQSSHKMRTRRCTLGGASRFFPTCFMTLSGEDTFAQRRYRGTGESINVWIDLKWILRSYSCGTYMDSPYEVQDMISLLFCDSVTCS